jgi:electron transfer flavoprotein alpha subunit
MTTLLIADGEATAHALTAALRLGGEVHILEVPANALAEPLAQSIAGLGGYDAIVAPATSTGKNLLPRIAALLDVMLISDILEVAAPDTFRRPTYAGNAIETVQSSDRIKVVTVRASAFPPTATHGLKAVSVAPADTTLSRIVSEDAQKAAGPELGSARIVVSGAAPSAARTSLTRSSFPLRKSSTPRSARAGRPSIPATPPMTSRSARPARSSPPISTSPSASRAPSSISPE